MSYEKYSGEISEMVNLKIKEIYDDSTFSEFPMITKLINLSFLWKISVFHWENFNFFCWGKPYMPPYPVAI